MAGVAAIRHHPVRHAGQTLEQADGLGNSWACPGAKLKAMARPEPSAITQALVPSG
jgi:hypothetical protein